MGRVSRSSRLRRFVLYGLLRWLRLEEIYDKLPLKMATKKGNKQLWILLALIVAVLTAILLLPGCGGRRGAGTATEEELATKVHAGASAPDFSVELLSGDTITLSELRGRVVLLNFWATWCPPCRQELARAQSDVIDRFAGRDFLFLPISRGEDRATVEAFRKKMGYTFEMGLDPTRVIYDRYASNFIPRNFLIGRDGKIIVASTGYEPGEFEALITAIEQALKE